MREQKDFDFFFENFLNMFTFPSLIDLSFLFRSEAILLMNRTGNQFRNWFQLEHNHGFDA